MSERVPDRPPTKAFPGAEDWRLGFALFAAVMMMMTGVFQAISAFAAILESRFYMTVGDYVFKLNVATWGWIHLLLGIIVAIAGVMIYVGTPWARVTGIVVAAVSAIGNFMFLPYYPIWSLLIIALDVIVIWALAVCGEVISHTAPRDL